MFAIAIYSINHLYMYALCSTYNIQEIAKSLQQVKHKGGSRPPIRTLGMGDISGDCGIFATCNPFQGF